MEYQIKTIKSKPVTTQDRLRKLLNEATKNYPKAWKLAESWLKVKNKGIPDWPDYCFLPTSGWYLTVCDALQVNNISLQCHPNVARLAALGSWRYTQSIYRINPTLYNSIIDTTLKGNLPVELLMRMPEWCIYIETPGLSYGNEVLNGFFAHLDWDVNSKKPELRLLLDREKGLLAIPLSIGDWTIAESVSRPLNKAVKAIKEKEGLDDGVLDYIQHRVTNHIQESGDKLRQLNPIISLLLYVCSDGVEYSGNTLPSNPTPKRIKKGWRLFAANHIRVWNLGNKTSKKLESEQAKLMSEAGQRQSISPHIRRAHWHTFYAGSRKNEQREIRVKWIPPLLVIPKSFEENLKSENNE